ncbi:putative phosphatase regulatory subunit-domain-containing protein [Umbelopsis sp. PMI_123]|nr:putative phosphatase regulatory subunit-domain-containing protein [Umbelopsis sp. PMI_123]
MPYTASHILVINATPTPSAQRLSTTLPRHWANNRRVSLKKASTDSATSPSQESLKPPKLHLNLESCSAPMVRKKSGEIVKSSLKCKSAPTTPTGPKFVHFNTELEHVRLFLKGQTPTAVHGDPPDLDDDNDEDDDDEDEDDNEVESDTHNKQTCKEVKLPNWPVRSSPVELLAKMVAMESIKLTQDQKSLVGSCVVSNISFHKQVIVRYTLNYWQDTNEIEASYREPCASGDASNSALDRFMFNIPITPKANQTLFLCVKYTVNGRDFWDNNDGRNYQVDVTKIATANKKNSRNHRVSDVLPIKSSRPLDVMDFGTSPPTVSISENKKKMWNRYDFGASLSAAKRTTSPTYKRVQSFPSYFSDVTQVDDIMKQPPPPVTVSTPSSYKGNATTAPIAIPRPAPGTPSYFDLVNKYCFYGNDHNSSIYSTSPNYSSSPAIRG